MKPVFVLLKTFSQIAYYGFLFRSRPESQRPKLKQQCSKQVLDNLGFKIHVHGAPKVNGPCILVGNHVSYLDIPLLLTIEPDAVFIAKDVVKGWPILGKTADSIGTIFVSREKNGDRSQAREQIKNALLKHPNAKVVVFPSGTTCLNESKIWKKGIFEIAQALKIPVQLFRVDYTPVRESAYIDDDQLVSQIMLVSKIKNKIAEFSWLERFDEIGNPVEFAERLRQKVKKQASQEYLRIHSPINYSALRSESGEI